MKIIKMYRNKLLKCIETMPWLFYGLAGMYNEALENIIEGNIYTL